MPWSSIFSRPRRGSEPPPPPRRTSLFRTVSVEHNGIAAGLRSHLGNASDADADVDADSDSDSDDNRPLGSVVSSSSSAPSHGARISLSQILASPTLTRQFQTYLVRVHAEENLHFLLRLREVCAAHAGAGVGAWDPRLAHRDARALVDEFFTHKSPLELNVPAAMRRRLLVALRARQRLIFGAPPATGAAPATGTATMVPSPTRRSAGSGNPPLQSGWVPKRISSASGAAASHLPSPPLSSPAMSPVTSPNVSLGSSPRRSFSPLSPAPSPAASPAIPVLPTIPGSPTPSHASVSTVVAPTTSHPSMAVIAPFLGGTPPPLLPLYTSSRAASPNPPLVPIALRSVGSVDFDDYRAVNAVPDSLRSSPTVSPPRQQHHHGSRRGRPRGYSVASEEEDELSDADSLELFAGDEMIGGNTSSSSGPDLDEDEEGDDEYDEVAAETTLGSVDQHRKRVATPSLRSVDATVSSSAAYFAAFVEVENHVADLLVPQLKTFVSIADQTLATIPRVPQRNQKRVVIIGGGFCGSLLARILDPMDRFQVCLIDTKPYFEYTAAIVRVIPDPTADVVTFPHASYIRHGQLVLGYVDAVARDHVVLQGAGDTTRIPFDYCVLATGSAYASSIKAANISSTYRARKLKYDYTKLAKARTVLVIGGGSVGVEIAAEIASVFGTKSHKPKALTGAAQRAAERAAASASSDAGEKPTAAGDADGNGAAQPRAKRVILVDAHTSLLRRCPARAGAKTLAYLRDELGVEVVLGERIVFHDERNRIFRARSGRVFRADAVYLATGPIPQTKCMEPYFGHLLTPPLVAGAAAPGVPESPLIGAAAGGGMDGSGFLGLGATADEVAAVLGPDPVASAAQAAGSGGKKSSGKKDDDAAAGAATIPRGRRVQVLPTHQLPGHGHIYIGGDCCSTDEEKLALTAQCAAITIARNIVRAEKGKPAIARGAKGTRPLMPDPPIQLISLGRASALAIVNGAVFLGPSYLRYKWDELKALYFAYLQDQDLPMPRTLRLMWGQPPNRLGADGDGSAAAAAAAALFGRAWKPTQAARSTSPGSPRRPDSPAADSVGSASSATANVAEPVALGLSTLLESLRV
ncbi:hypothetical protein H9P43_008137 [Blastocladiella emersonii ATCC 22665]|nr:hypothetical protein H9P43_008137 [Blastocladiella emersonii ATCC 22665]